MNFEDTEKPLPLADILHPTPHPGLNRRFAALTEKFLCLRKLEETYEAARSGSEGHYQFVHGLLGHLKIRYQVHRENFESDYRRGPAIVVANHPYGGIDAIIMACVLLGIRTDLKILSNSLLCRIPELSDLIIGVDSFGKKGSKSRNGKPIRKAVDWVKKGGMLMLFFGWRGGLFETRSHGGHRFGME